MAHEFKHPILGQEAVVGRYGLGRVVSFMDNFPVQYIEVKPYVCDYAMKFAPDNVDLVPILGQPLMLHLEPASKEHPGNAGLRGILEDLLCSAKELRDIKVEINRDYSAEDLAAWAATLQLAEKVVELVCKSDVDPEIVQKAKQILLQDLEAQDADKISCKCDNCGHVCDISELDEAKHLDQRLEYPPGHPKCVMPAGECPECGCLSYAIDSGRKVS